MKFPRLCINPCWALQIEWSPPPNDIAPQNFGGFFLADIIGHPEDSSRQDLIDFLAVSVTVRHMLRTVTI